MTMMGATSRVSHWMAEYARDLVLKSYCDGDESKRFCFLRVPDFAHTGPKSLLILDVSVSSQVLFLYVSFEIFSPSQYAVTTSTFPDDGSLRYTFGT